MDQIEALTEIQNTMGVNLAQKDGDCVINTGEYTLYKTGACVRLKRRRRVGFRWRGGFGSAGGGEGGTVRGG